MSVETAGSEPVQLNATEAIAAMSAVTQWIESAYHCADLLAGFGFHEQSNWINDTAGLLETVIDAACESVKEEGK